MKLFAHLCCVIGGLLITLLSHTGNTITAAVDEDIIADYQLFVGERDPLSINYYGGPGARRDVIEIVLLQQALHLGGFEGKVVLRPENSYLRVLKLIQDGQVPISGALMWRNDIKPYAKALFKTQALVHEGEFIAGLYTRASNTRALAATTLEQIRQLSAASNDHWQADIATLKSLGIKKIYYATYWVQIVRMVVAGRADITLAPFQSNPEMKVQVENLELIPIPGVKVTLPGSRHWPVSKKHPRGQEIFTALKKGIALLEQQNTIQRAYEECGFFHPRVKEWTLLNAPDNSAQPRSISTSSKSLHLKP
ncbi:hypothetical protein [Cellvibrio sp. OA-2007]|uniref:hypothetical protein n=1 Tax=Cellvibrio sp. OA-2007 TaxID=529823 RepID=UPI00078340AC|nr:hypothetical protein [Cellvibrio sp. OA-2007]